MRKVVAEKQRDFDFPDAKREVVASPEPGKTKISSAWITPSSKIEVTPVLRGCVYDQETRSVSPAVETRFGFAEMQVFSFADLCAGRLVAALDPLPTRLSSDGDRSVGFSGGRRLGTV
jgi:hypothetical protein